MEEAKAAPDVVHTVSHLPQHDSPEPHSPTKKAKKTVCLSVYLVTVAIFVAIILALGLGLGLGLGLHRNTISSSSSTDANFNYSSFYGIPDSLPTADSANLINTTQLDLQTNFAISNTTSQVREYTFNITQGLAAPDGYQRPMILINGQFPGPLIEVNSGDTIRVHVNNLMANWSTAIHWHGIDQVGSVEMDGVAAITQCGIPPGASFTYEFGTEGQRGSFWYHSHLSTQLADGLMGPLIIHDPSEMVPAVDGEKIVFMGDWYHTYSSVLLASYMNPTPLWTDEPGIEPMPDNLVFNGQNTYDCSVKSTTYPAQSNPTVCSGGNLYNTTFQQNKSYRLRLINHSSFMSYWFSIDNHTVSIVEVDGVEIEPIDARGVYVNLGQRYSVIVTTNQTAGNYYMRATLGTSCYLPFMPYNNTAFTSGGFHVLGIMNYDGIDPSATPIGVAGNTTNPNGAADNEYNDWVYEGCNELPFDQMVPMRAAAAYDISPENMHYMQYQFEQSQNMNRVFLNGTSWAPMENNATLLKASDPAFLPSSPSSNTLNLGPLGNQQVLLSPDASGGVQLVINSYSDMQHPFHLHGHTPQIIGWGLGLYGPENATTWNLANPARRDTFTVPAKSHVVLRWQNDNPGVWALHCHVAWHMESGMLLMMAEQPEKLAGMMAALDAATFQGLYGVCGTVDDQAFGTYVDEQYLPANLVPSVGAKL